MTEPDPDDLPSADDVLRGRGEVNLRITDESPQDTGADPDDGTPEVPDEGTRLISADVSCENCAHREVCSILRGIQPMLDGWNGEAPIDPTDLAAICDAWLHEDEVSD